MSERGYTCVYHSKRTASKRTPWFRAPLVLKSWLPPFAFLCDPILECELHTHPICCARPPTSHGMLHFVLANCAMLHFGTFARHTPPPMVQKPVVKPLSDIITVVSSASNDTLIGYVGHMTPTLSSCCTFVCWEGDDMHYFKYTTSDVLRLCIWGAPSMSLSRKAVVLANMRCWWVENANANLTMALHNECDYLSWTMATMLLDRGG